MKLLLLGDTHFTNKVPEKRTDDYYATMMRKFESVLDIFAEEGCDLLLQAGDFFDSPHVSNSVIGDLIEVIQDKIGTNKIACIYGQHDLYGHNAESIKKSPLYLLQKAKCVTIIEPEGTTIGDIHLHGASFGQKVYKNTKKGLTILVVHDMVGEHRIYAGQDMTDAERYLRKHSGYRLILCGDNHNDFHVNYEGRDIINCGCMMRKTTADADRKLGVWIFDTDTDSLKYRAIEYQAPEDVFDFTKKKEAVSLSDENIKKFVSELKTQKGAKVGWRSVLNGYRKQENVSDAVISIIDDCLVEIGSTK